MPTGHRALGPGAPLCFRGEETEAQKGNHMPRVTWHITKSLASASSPSSKPRAGRRLTTSQAQTMWPCRIWLRKVE